MDHLTQSKAARAVIAVSLAALTAWLYWPTLGHTFVWDDYPYLVDSSRYWDIRRFPELFFEPFGLSRAYYRPLALATFALYPVTADGGATLHHAINVGLHATNSALMFVLLVSLRGHSSASRHVSRDTAVIWPSVATIVFAAHPVMIEPVAWISGRFDVLMTFFLISALLIDRFVSSSRARAGMIGAATFCALLCKESAIGWIAALPLIHLAASRPEHDSPRHRALAIWNTHRLTYAAIALALVVYLALRAHALGEIKPVTLGTWQGEPLDRLVVALITSWKYAAMTALPWIYAGPLQPFEFENARSAANLITASFGALLMICASIAILWQRARLLLPLSVWLVTLWPVLNLLSFPNGETIVADRYLMLPILSAIYTVALVKAHQVRHNDDGRIRQVAPVLIATVWLVASVAVVRITLPLWRDNFSFWSFVLQRYPESPTALGNLGREYLLRGELQRAEVLLAKSFQLRPSLAGCTNLAYVLALQGETRSARQQIALIPQDIVRAATANEQASLENTLGWLEESDGNRDAARQHFQNAIALDPTLWKARLNLAKLLAREGARIEAEQQLALVPATLTADGHQRVAAVRELLLNPLDANPLEH